MHISIIQGPNLNLLGTREKHIYGDITLEQMHKSIKDFASSHNIKVDFFQSNIEGELIDKLHECLRQKVDGIIINPAAYTHTSIALKDAISAIDIPCVEVHLSNIHAREDFRKVSHSGSVSKGVISGFGAFGYNLAILALQSTIKGA